MAGAVYGEDGLDQLDRVVELVGGFVQRDLLDQLLVLAALDRGHVGFFLAETQHFVAALDVFAEASRGGRHHLLEVAQVVLEAVDDVAHWLVDDVLVDALLAVFPEEHCDVDQVALQVFDLVQAQQLLERGGFVVQDVVQAVDVFVLVVQLLDELVHRVSSLRPEVHARSLQLLEPGRELLAVLEEELVAVVLSEDLVQHQRQQLVLFCAVARQQVVDLLDLVAHVDWQLLVDVSESPEHFVLAFRDVERLPELLADVDVVLDFDRGFGLDGDCVGFLREESLEHLKLSIVNPVQTDN